MKVILSLFLFLSICSCQDSHQEEDRQSNKLDTNSRFSNKNYQVYTLEGCEYIVVDFGTSKWGSHKGNCKNPIHKNQEQFSQ
jgi:hypothetical protein